MQICVIARASLAKLCNCNSELSEVAITVWHVVQICVGATVVVQSCVSVMGCCSTVSCDKLC